MENVQRERERTFNLNETRQSEIIDAVSKGENKTTDFHVFSY